MSAPAALSATFCGMRTVASRKVAQITMEVPIEQMGTVLSVLGPPSGVDPQWVAIALLDKKAAAQARGADKAPVPTKSPGRKFSELPNSQQAALLCERADFRKFLAEEEDATESDTAEDAAFTVRHICGITSRAELDTNPEAAKLFDDLHDRFTAWRLV